MLGNCPVEGLRGIDMEMIHYNYDDSRIETAAELAIEKAIHNRSFFESDIRAWTDDDVLDVFWTVEEQFEKGRDEAFVAIHYLEVELTRRGIEVSD